MEFRERLYQLRKGRGISQEELAHTVGVSRQAVQKWEAGAATPDLNNLSALADYFAVSLDYLVRQRGHRFSGHWRFFRRPAVHRRPGCRTADPGRTGRGDRRRGRTGRRSPACPGRRCVQPGAGTGRLRRQPVCRRRRGGGGAVRRRRRRARLHPCHRPGRPILRAYGGNTEALFQMIHAQLPEAPEWVVRLLLCVCP